MNTKTVCTISAVALFANIAIADEIGWVGVSGGRWGDGANWSGGVVPSASDTAVFALKKDMRTILASDEDVAKIVVTGAQLDLYSGAGKTLTLSGENPEIAVGADAGLRVSGVKLASTAKVSKTGVGQLVVVDKAASEVELAHAEGEVMLEDALGKDMAVSANDTYWTFEGINKEGSSVQHSPYGGSDGILLGNEVGNCVTVTARREPIKINGMFRISGDVLMEGMGSHGFAVVLHNDPRGYLARTIWQGAASLGYAGSNESKQPIQKSFAWGIRNYYSADGRIMWGWNGAWQNPSGQDGELTDPLIYTSPCGSNQTTGRHPRRFKFQLDFDQSAKTAAMTLIQDQSEIVSGGSASVTYTKKLAGVDLTEFCESDTATLAFTTDANTRNTAVAVSNLKVEYVKADPHLKNIVTVIPSEKLWESCTFGSNGVESEGDVYGSQEGSVRVGAGTPYKGSVTACKEKVEVSGKFRISGKVTDTGSGAWGWALVLHNDPRGSLAHATPAQNNTMAFSGDDKIAKSYAFRVINYSSFKGQVSDGRNGAWTSLRTTNPLILTNPYDGDSKQQVEGGAKYAFDALFDARAKTMVLTLTQDQNGETKTAVETFTAVDVPDLVGDESAYISLLSDAGGRYTDAVIDDFKIEYLAYDDEITGFSFFKDYEAIGARPVVTATSGDADFEANVGSLKVTGGALQFGLSANPTVTVVKSEELWDSRSFGSDGLESQGVVYGSLDGSVHVGANAGKKASVTARKEKVDVKGNLLISGKVTDTGSGAWGWALVLHNDPRGSLAHAIPAQNNTMAFSGDDKIAKSYAFRVINYSSSKGQVSDGKNGAWNSVRTTDPLILTNPYDGDTKQQVEGGAQYEFSAFFDACAKTMTLTLTQDQEGELTTAVETFVNVDVSALVDGDKAYVALLSDASTGRTTNVVIDDFKIEYPSSGRDQSVFTSKGRAVIAEGGELTLDNSSFKIQETAQLLDFKVFRLNNGGSFVVDAGMKARIKSVFVDDVRIPHGIYTASDCAWIDGLGSVELRDSGLLVIFR